MKTIPYEDIKARLMQKPGFREAYEALGLEFELAQTIISARALHGLTQAELAAATGTRAKITLEPLTEG